MGRRQKQIKELKDMGYEQRLVRSRGLVRKYTENYFNETTGETKCKLCGTTIRALREFDGRKIAVETSSYVEITLLMDDGSAHETCLCKNCGYNITDEEAELCYLIDIGQWQKEARKLKNGTEWIEPLKNRVPQSTRPFSRTFKQVGK